MEPPQGITKPPRLVLGDTIGIAAPACALAPAVPPVLLPAFRRGIDALQCLGYRVRIAPHVLDAQNSPDVPAWQRATPRRQPGGVAFAGGDGLLAILRRPRQTWHRSGDTVVA